MGFSGWPPSMVAFYSELEVRNDKAFWEDNRHVYDADVRGPMEALVEALSGEFGAATIFRPHRDVRFSKDKSPYKTEVAAIFGTPYGGGRYVRASADGVAAGGGYHHMAPDQLARFRDAVVDPDAGAELDGVLGGLVGADGITIHSDALKTAPRGWPRDHPRIGHLRRRSLTAVREVPPGPTVHSADILDVVRDTFRTVHPLLAWLDRHVGPSTDPRAGRRGT